MSLTNAQWLLMWFYSRCPANIYTGWLRAHAGVCGDRNPFIVYIVVLLLLCFFLFISLCAHHSDSYVLCAIVTRILTFLVVFSAMSAGMQIYGARFVVFIAIWSPSTQAYIHICVRNAFAHTYTKIMGWRTFARRRTNKM